MIQLQWFLVHAQILFSVCGILGYLYNFGPSIWTLSRTSIITILVGTSLLLRTAGGKSIEFKDVSGLVAVALFIVAFVAVIVLTYLWIVRNFRSQTASKLSPDQYCCLVYMLALILNLFGLLMIGVFGSGQNKTTLSREMATTTATITVVTYVISALHSRRSRLEEADTKVMDSIFTSHNSLRMHFILTFYSFNSPSWLLMTCFLSTHWR